jgi:hypothetical protein
MKTYLKLVTLQIFTTCFDQYGHHQELKVMDDETVVLLRWCLFVNVWFSQCACVCSFLLCSTPCLVENNMYVVFLRTRPAVHAYRSHVSGNDVKFSEGEITLLICSWRYCIPTLTAGNDALLVSIINLCEQKSRETRRAIMSDTMTVYSCLALKSAWIISETQWCNMLEYDNLVFGYVAIEI